MRNFDCNGMCVTDALAEVAAQVRDADALIFRVHPRAFEAARRELLRRGDGGVAAMGPREVLWMFADLRTALIVGDRALADGEGVVISGLTGEKIVIVGLMP